MPAAEPAPEDRRRSWASIALNGHRAQMTRASCSSRARKQHPLHLPAGQRAIGRGSKPVRPTAEIALSTVSRSFEPMPPNRLFAAPQTIDTCRRQLIGKLRSIFGDLRQVGDVLRPHAVDARSAPASGLITPTTPLNSVDLPARSGRPPPSASLIGRRRRDDARPDDGRSPRVRSRNCSCAVIGFSPHCQYAASQSRTISPAETASRCSATTQDRRCDPRPAAWTWPG